MVLCNGIYNRELYYVKTKNKKLKVTLKNISIKSLNHPFLLSKVRKRLKEGPHLKSL